MARFEGSLIWALVVALLVFIFVLETVLRELKAPAILRPLYWVRRHSEFVKYCYYLVGLGLGWCWYVCCVVARFFADRLWRAVRETLQELFAAVAPYFHVGEIWRGMKIIAWDYWMRWRLRIRTGVVIIASVPLGALVCHAGVLAYRAELLRFTAPFFVVPSFLAIMCIAFVALMCIAQHEATMSREVPHPRRD